MDSVENTSMFSKKTSLSFRGIAILMVMLSHYAEWCSWFHTFEGAAETIRHFLTGLGPYGVAVFLLFSGYGLTKSAGNNRIGFRFILKRFFSVYIPYLVVVFLINLLSNGLTTVEDWIDMLIGDDFWYMTVLFIFYIAFMIIWAIFKNIHLRAIFLIIITLLVNYYFASTGKQDFWFISNYAFLIGSLCALYEFYCQKVMNILGWYLTIAFGAGTVFAMRNDILVDHLAEPIEQQINRQIYSVLIFLVFIIFLSAKTKVSDPVTLFIGKNTLCLYLTHTFIFMWTVNALTLSVPLRFFLALIFTFIVSFLFQYIFSLIQKRIRL